MDYDNDTATIANEIIDDLEPVTAKEKDKIEVKRIKTKGLEKKFKKTDATEIAVEDGETIIEEVDKPSDSTVVDQFEDVSAQPQIEEPLDSDNEPKENDISSTLQRRASQKKKSIRKNKDKEESSLEDSIEKLTIE